jgi:hypothetical protein
MSFECSEDPRRQFRTEVARRSRHLDVQEATPSIVIMLGKHDCIWTAVVSQQPQSVLQAPPRFTAADIDVFELRRRDVDRGMALFQQLGEVRYFVAKLGPDPNEILWDDSLSKQLIEGCLKIRLLAERKGTRSRQ